MLVTSERVEELLTSNGYQEVRRTAGHALYEDRGDRIVIPCHAGELSPWSARVIEWTLEPRLGAGWLLRASEPDAVDGTDEPPAAPTRLTLDLTIRPEPDRSAWNAFVVQEPRILTFGPTIAAVRQLAADAVRAWFAESADVELRVHVQPDRETKWWLDRARAADGGTCGTEADLRRQLAHHGYADHDLDDLVALLGER